MSDITYSDTHQFGDDVLVKGTKIKFKNNRDEYAFQRLAKHERLGVEWIDCVDVLRQSWHSFYADELLKVVKPRRRRSKK